MSLLFALTGEQPSFQPMLLRRLTAKGLTARQIPTDSAIKQQHSPSDCIVLDFGGAAALPSPSDDEAIHLIRQQNPKAIVQVLDGSAPAEGLRLSKQLRALKLPMIVVLHNVGQLPSEEKAATCRDLSKQLGIPVFSVCSDNHKEMDDVIDAALRVSAALPTETGTALSHADQFLLKPLFGIPTAFAVMTLVFYLTFGPLGSKLQAFIQFGIDAMINACSNLMIQLELPVGFQSFLIDGVFAGLGSLLIFLPPILIFSFSLSILETSGYLARVSAMLNGIFERLGLGHFMPASGSLRGKKVYSSSLASLSLYAVIPMFGMAAMPFFSRYTPLVLASVCAAAIAICALTSFIHTCINHKLRPVNNIPQLPAYRFPPLGHVVSLSLRQTIDFLQGVFTFALACSILIWFLQRFDWSLHMVSNPSASILAALFSVASIPFALLGFSDWRAVAALFIGLISRESIVSTFSILTGGGSREHLSLALQEIFTPVSAVSFLLFLCCVMLSAALYRKRKASSTSVRTALFATVLQLLLGYLAALAFNQIGSLIF